MSPATMSPTDDQIRDALQRHDRQDLAPIPGRTNHLPGAVLVPLIRRPHAPLSVIVEARPLHLRLHPGELVFPGGRPEEGDADLSETALREAVEELGPGLEDAQIVGRLSSIPLFTSDYRIHPFVALVGDVDVIPSEDEVAAVVEVPIAPWYERPNLDAISWNDRGALRLAPVFGLQGRPRPMFGGTAFAFHELLGVLAPLFDAELPPLREGRYAWDAVLDAARWAT